MSVYSWQQGILPKTGSWNTKKGQGGRKGIYQRSWQKVARLWAWPHTAHSSCGEQSETQTGGVALQCAKRIEAVCPLQTLHSAQPALRAEDFASSWLALSLTPQHCKAADDQPPLPERALQNTQGYRQQVNTSQKEKQSRTETCSPSYPNSQLHPLDRVEISGGWSCFCPCFHMKRKKIVVFSRL